MGHYTHFTHFQGDIPPMTEKELKKLSRLELLELLLEASTENRALKERVASLSAEVNKAQDIQQLSAAIQQIESALKYTDHITAMVKTTACEMSKSGNEHAMEEPAATLSTAPTSTSPWRTWSCVRRCS